LIPLVLADEYLSPLPGSRILQRERDKARYKTAARVIAISQATRRDLIERLGILPERIDVVHQGVDHERFNPAPAPDEQANLANFLEFRGHFYCTWARATREKTYRCSCALTPRAACLPT